MVLGGSPQRCHHPSVKSEHRDSIPQLSWIFVPTDTGVPKAVDNLYVEEDFVQRIIISPALKGNTKIEISQLFPEPPLAKSPISERVF